MSHTLIKSCKMFSSHACKLFFIIVNICHNKAPYFILCIHFQFHSLLWTLTTQGCVFILTEL